MKQFFLMSSTVCLLGCALLSLEGCGPKAFTNGNYNDPNKVNLLDDKFNEADMQQMAEAIVDAIVTCPSIRDARVPPTVAVSKVANRTNEFPDLDSLTEMIRTHLTNSRKVRFIDRSERSEIDSEQQYGASGKVSKDSAKTGGKQIAIDYLLNGALATNVQQVGSDKLVYYKLTMNLTNTDTSVIDCTQEKEVRKAFKKQSVGLF